MTCLRIISTDGGEMPTEMNFGCGNTIESGRVNVDVSISPYIGRLYKNKEWILNGRWTDPHQFAKDQFSYIKAIDVLEHFHPDEIPNILYCFRCCLTRNGVLRVEVPNFQKMAKIISEIACADLDLENLNTFRQIELDWMAPYIHDGAGHKSIWTPSIARHRLTREGFGNIVIKDKNPNTLVIIAERM